MKKTIFVLITAALLAVLYISGPEIESDMTSSGLPEINDPVKYITESESTVHDMRPDNNKTIIWAGQPGEKTEHSIIYLHGFTAARNETAPLTKILAEKTGSNVFYTRLKGHGRYELRSQENISISDWLNDAEEALSIGKEIGDKVIIISCSTGTALASWLAENYPDEIEALVMISPNFEPADRRIFLLSGKWGPVLGKLIEGEIIGENEHIVSPQHANNWTYIYRTEMVFPVAALLKYIDAADFSKIETPVAMFYSSNDKIVNYKKTLEVFEKWGSDIKIIEEVPDPGDKNGHVIAGDIFSPATTGFVSDKTMEFFEKLNF